jgi:hypothetical protein
VYGRSYAGRTLHFEASGGLVNSALIMRDRETDSYWSLMQGKATAGPLVGTAFEEIPGSRKMRFAKWVARHPETHVLSVNGREHARDPYADYWRSRRGFRGQRAEDRRLPTKAPIFAFSRAGQPFAIAHTTAASGHVVPLDGGERLFLHRAAKASAFESTAAYVSRAGFVQQEGVWIELEYGAAFDPALGEFKDRRVRAQTGLDTYWYTWSLSHPTTQLLE